MGLTAAQYHAFLAAPTDPSPLRADMTAAQYAGILAAVQASAIPPGTVSGFGTMAVPSGWLACDGSAVSRTTYAALFAAIGTVWGAGDGATTFNLPNLEGKFLLLTANPVGVGAGGGSTTATLSAANLPAHTHTVPVDGSAISLTPGSTSVQGTGDAKSVDLATSSVGSGTAFAILPPYNAVLACIKT